MVLEPYRVDIDTMWQIFNLWWRYVQYLDITPITEELKELGYHLPITQKYLLRGYRLRHIYNVFIEERGELTLLLRNPGDGSPVFEQIEIPIYC